MRCKDFYMAPTPQEEKQNILLFLHLIVLCPVILLYLYCPEGFACVVVIMIFDFIYA